jgi:hypothetical protein
VAIGATAAVAMGAMGIGGCALHTQARNDGHAQALAAASFASPSRVASSSESPSAAPPSSALPSAVAVSLPAASPTVVASAASVGDPDAIQQCLPYRVNQISPETLIAGYDTTLGAATRYLDALGGGPSQPLDAQRASTAPVSVCIFDGSFDTPGFLATRMYVMIGRDSALLYPSMFNDDTGPPARPGA